MCSQRPSKSLIVSLQGGSESNVPRPSKSTERLQRPAMVVKHKMNSRNALSIDMHASHSYASLQDA